MAIQFMKRHCERNCYVQNLAEWAIVLDAIVIECRRKCEVVFKKHGSANGDLSLVIVFMDAIGLSGRERRPNRKQYYSAW